MILSKQYDLCIDVLCDINGIHLNLTELHQLTAIFFHYNVCSYLHIVLRKHFHYPVVAPLVPL